MFLKEKSQPRITNLSDAELDIQRRKAIASYETILESVKILESRYTFLERDGSGNYGVIKTGVQYEK